MDIIIKNMLDEQITLLNEKLRLQTQKLEQLAPFSNICLSKCTRKNGKIYYYQYVQGLGKETKKYISRDSEVVDYIKEFRYLNLSVQRIKKNIELLEQIESEFLPIDYDSINNALSDTYRGARIHREPSVDEKIEKWLKQMNQFKIEFEKLHPDPHPEALRIQTESGLFVRSKSESNISNFLDSCGLPYIYELPHYCNGQWIRSDFTILSPIDGTTIFILEHEGLLY